MNGTLLCTRYAFPPNYFQYCGPDENRTLSEYLRAQSHDHRLSGLLKQFPTLYSYLAAIAHANNIEDPFDPRVVRAYWLGNPLLESLNEQDVHTELAKGQQLERRFPRSMLKWIYSKISIGARLHHSFHVFNVFIRTGHLTLPITVESMDNCRIGWGKVLKKNGTELTLTSQKIELHEGRLRIKRGIKRTVKTMEPARYKAGDLVSYHWGWVCDTITIRDAQYLNYYTKLSLALANSTL